VIVIVDELCIIGRVHDFFSGQCHSSVNGG
jgi:hypothetical protein